MKKYILYIVAVLAGALVSTPVFAETMKSEVNIKPSMTLDVPVSSINLNLDPATNAFASKDINITVGTNNKTGYWITMSSSTGESDLVNIDDNTKTIPTIATAGSYTSSNFPINQWGYKIDSGNYTPFISGATIKSSSTTANGETFKLNIASKIDYLQPSGTYNMALNIKMLPNMTTNYIQNLDSALCTEDPMVVIDNRDEQPYVVQRLKDGKCWMMDNLNLGAVELRQDLTSANTNLATMITADTFNSWKHQIGIGSTIEGDYSPVTSDNSTTGQASDPVSENRYGTLYNYYSATAGTIGGSNTTNAEYDICAAGWKMPTGGVDGEYKKLSDSINSYEKMRASVRNGGAAFPLSGWYDDGYSPYGQGKTGSRYWASTNTAGSTINADALSFEYKNGNYVVVADGDTMKKRGRAVRCLLKES